MQKTVSMEGTKAKMPLTTATTIDLYISGADDPRLGDQDKDQITVT